MISWRGGSRGAAELNKDNGVPGVGTLPKASGGNVYVIHGPYGGSIFSIFRCADANFDGRIERMWTTTERSC